MESTKYSAYYERVLYVKSNVQRPTPRRCGKHRISALPARCDVEEMLYKPTERKTTTPTK